MLFCEYSNLFGEPKKGFHKNRIFASDTFEGFAINDLLGTVIAAVLIAKWNSWSILYTVIGALLFGILAHYLFCVDTTLNKIVLGRTKNEPSESKLSD